MFCDMTSLLNAFLSLWSWFLVMIGTITFSLTGFFIFWPLSLIFERGNGRMLHGVSRAWAYAIGNLLPFWEIKSEGAEHIKKGVPYIVVSNHQSLMDIVVLLAQLPLHFKFIAKRELFWIPFFGWHLALAGYIPLKRGDAESGRQCLVKAKYWLDKGVSIIFFPEGTRSPDGQIHEFKAGAFKLALEGPFDTLPVVITGTRDAIPKHSWIVKKRSVLSLKILPPMSTKDRSLQELESIRDHIRTIILSEFERLQCAS